jgi:hypothetical protein
VLIAIPFKKLCGIHVRKTVVAKKLYLCFLLSNGGGGGGWCWLVLFYSVAHKQIFYSNKICPRLLVIVVVGTVYKCEEILPHIRPERS